MALEVRFNVTGLKGRAITNAGYTVMDSVRNQLQEGFVNIDVDGLAIIPITSKWVELNESLRVTVDDFDGLNFTTSGSATDVIKTTTAYVEYSATQEGIYVHCVKATLSETDEWDMGDGEFVTGDVFTYLYKDNGTFTITSGDFTKVVTITDVIPFSVTLNENVITCTPQSGIFETWNFGDGETAPTGTVIHELTSNGTYIVTNGIYQQSITLNYFSEGLIKNVVFNKVTFNELLVSGDIVYGDGETGTSLTHEYPNHGRFLVKVGDNKSYVTVVGYKIPTASYTTSLNEDDSSIVTFTCAGGDTYQSSINGEEFYERVTTYDFPASGYYDYVLNATLDNGNSNQLAKKIKALENNTLPEVSFTVVQNELEVQFTAVVIDNDFEASHSYLWTFNKGSQYELYSYNKDPVHSYQNPTTPNDPDGQEFTVELRVTDNVGAVVTSTKTITVYDF